MEERLACMLLIDVNGVFGYASRNCLLCTIVGMSADRDLMR